MAEKNVKVTLTANVENYVRGIKEAAEHNKKLAQGSGNAEQTIRLQTEAAQQLGPVMLGAGAAMLTFAGVAIKTAADFERSMSGVAADTGEGGAALESLRQAALDAGADTAFSATEAADAIGELGKAGIQTADIIGGALTGALDLAAAGGLEVAAAAEITATTLQQFKLDGSDASHVADLLAAGAGKATGSVDDMAQALKYVGVPASDLGISVEDTAGSIALLASNAIVGEQAGTSLRSMLVSIAAPTKVAQAVMDEYGISVYDAENKFVGMEGMAGVLEERLGGLDDKTRTAALSQIFGNEALGAAQAIMREGADGVAEWTQKVDDSGFAARVAAEKTNNLWGDIERLGGSFETAMIKIGSSGQGPLRAIVTAIGGVVDGVDALDPVAQGLILTTTLLAGSILTVGGAGLIIIPQIAATIAALGTLGITAATARGAVQLLGTALMNPAIWGAAAAVTAIVALKQATDNLGLSSEEMQGALRGSTKAIETYGAAAQSLSEGLVDIGMKEATIKQLGDLQGVLDALGRQRGALEGWRISETFAIGTEYDNSFRALKNIGEELANIAQTDAPEAARAFKMYADETDGSTRSIMELLNAMPEYRDALHAQANASGEAIGDLEELGNQTKLAEYAQRDASVKAEELNTALSGQAEAAKDAAGGIEQTADALREYNELLYDSLNAEMDYYESLDALTAALEKNGATLDLTTEAGRDNMSALMDAGQATRDYAADIWQTTGSAEEMELALQNGWNEVYNAALAMGVGEEQAKAYADELVGVPSEVTTEIQQNAIPAKDDVEAYIAALNRIPSNRHTLVSVDKRGAQTEIDTFINDNNGRTITIFTNTKTNEQQIKSSGNQTGKAAGGPIYGSGAKGVDSVPILAAPNEHMWTSAEVDALGGHGAMYALRAAVLNGGLSGYSGGGPVQSGGSGRGPVNVSITVNAQQGQGDGSLARTIRRELEESLR